MNKQSNELLAMVGRLARYSVLPLGLYAIKVFWSKGPHRFWWNLVGEALLQFFRHSGPVFIKLGQLLATRKDLLGENISKNLTSLFNEQSPMAKGEVTKILNQHYGPDWPFEHLVLSPLGVGSIGQVHEAILKENKEKIILKILRPNLEQLVDKDLETLEKLLEIFGKTFLKNNPSSHFILKKNLDDLKTGIKMELNLKNELESLVLFKKRMKKNPKVYIPKVYEQYCFRDILVMEKLEGELLSDYLKSQTQSFDNKELAREIFKEILEQIFEMGTFHADPHPGNIIVLPDQKIGLIDLGLVGEFTPKEKKYLSKAIKAIIAKDPDGVIKALISFGRIPPDWNEEDFKDEIIACIRKNKNEVLKSVKGKMAQHGHERLDLFVQELFAIAYKYHLFIPSSTVLLIKTLITVEGVVKNLDETMDTSKVAVPIILKAVSPDWIKWIFKF